mmetsp:Transcript_71673/g.164278  ORF Transcript_71673/g.164278 Transcript_71673/m.164278 type:complete len:107 (+) Transcript_71673:669-989(+)
MAILIVLILITLLEMSTLPTPIDRLRRRPTQNSQSRMVVVRVHVGELQMIGLGQTVRGTFGQSVYVAFRCGIFCSCSPDGPLNCVRSLGFIRQFCFAVAGDCHEVQ